MILTALKELAEREGLLNNADYEPKEVTYLVKIGKGGKFLGLIRTEGNGKFKKGKKPRPKQFFVPMRSPRTSQDWAEFLVDKGEYIFGWSEDENDNKKVERAKRRQQLFLQLINEAYEGTGHDEGVKAVLQFLECYAEGSVKVNRPEDCTNGDLFGFIYGDESDLISSRPAVVSYWSNIRFFRVQMIPPEEAIVAQCAATGEIDRLVRLHPAIKGVPPISDTKGGVPLTSINAEAFESYGLKSISCAPISQQVADGYGKALERLLSPAYPSPRDGSPLPKRHVRFSNNTVVVFWSKEESEFLDFFSDAVEADPEAVRAVYDATWKGHPVRLDNPTAFYALTLSGAQGRATIRNWFESTVKDVVKNVQTHFSDLQINRPQQNQGEPFPLWQILRSTAVLSKLENIHPNLATDIFEAVLKGQVYPHILLEASIRRIKAEREIPPVRAALIKAYLVRAKRLNKLPNNFPEVKPMLDKNCENTAYRLGRLFSVLEKIQQDATRAGTTIRDRYYGAASATPVVVFAQLLRKVPHHIAKLGHSVFYEKLIQEILSPLPPQNAFPSSLTLEEQGLFALGYYHQRQDLFTKSGDKNSEKEKNND